MAKLILFDEQRTRLRLLPFTFTRPIADIRLGILPLREKWERRLEIDGSGSLTAPHLQDAFPADAGDDNLLVNAALLPDEDNVHAISDLQPGQSLTNGEVMMAARLDEAKVAQWNEQGTFEQTETLQYHQEITLIGNSWDLFKLNGREIEHDFHLVTAGRKSENLNDNNRIIGSESELFIEPGAVINGATINTRNSPVYIGKNTEIMEGVVIRGPLAMCESSVLKMSAKIYGPTTLGPHCKVGGEVNNSIFFGYSNKAHDGFLGNSVIGEWCNLGADTNNSNLKNNYDHVRVWDYEREGFTNTGETFCGLFMGDHSKCGINTMFNTGTVVGVSANVFGGGFPRNFIPSYSWGGAQGFAEYKLEKALDVAERMMNRRELSLNTAERKVLEAVFEQTARYRNFK